MIKGKEMKSLAKFSVIILLCCGGIAFVNTSCNHTNQYPLQTATLDSISKVLTKVDSMLGKTDSAHIRKCVNNVIIDQDFVKASGTDSMSKEAQQILKTYSNTRWELQIFLGRKPVLRYEIKKSVEQVDHLSHDLQKGLVLKDSVLIFYAYEMKKATELAEAGKYGLEVVKVQVPLNEMVAPQADSLVARLRNHEKI
jgi:hypothetical protein